MSPSKLFLSTGRLSRHFPPTRMSPARKKSTFYGYDKLAISLMLNEVDPGLDVVFDRLYSVQISDWPVVESMNFPHLTLLQQGTAVWSWVWFRHCVWQAPMKHRDASVQVMIQTLCLTGSHEAPWCLGANQGWLACCGGNGLSSPHQAQPAGHQRGRRLVSWLFGDKSPCKLIITLLHLAV